MLLHAWHTAEIVNSTLAELSEWTHSNMRTRYDFANLGFWMELNT